MLSCFIPPPEFISGSIFSTAKAKKATCLARWRVGVQNLKFKIQRNQLPPITTEGKNTFGLPCKRGGVVEGGETLSDVFISFKLKLQSK